MVSHFEFDQVSLLDFEVEDLVLVAVVADTLKIDKTSKLFNP